MPAAASGYGHGRHLGRSATAATTRRAYARAATPAGNRTAVKVWDMRAVPRLRRHAGIGHAQLQGGAARACAASPGKAPTLELDLDDTIASTARNAGHLDLRMVPERRNTVKVLMLLDVGGSMDDHIARVEELFSAARRPNSATWMSTISTTALYERPAAGQPAPPERAASIPGTSCASTTPTGA